MVYSKPMPSWTELFDRGPPLSQLLEDAFPEDNYGMHHPIAVACNSTVPDRWSSIPQRLPPPMPTTIWDLLGVPTVQDPAPKPKFDPNAPYPPPPGGWHTGHRMDLLELPPRDIRDPTTWELLEETPCP